MKIQNLPKEYENKIEIPGGALYIEISVKNDELFNFWDIERITKAFNFGHGTEKDFLRYAENNQNFARFYKVA